MLLSGDPTEIEQKFSVTIQPTLKQEQRFELVSKTPGADFKSIQASFIQGTLSSMKLIDKAGNITQFNFSEVDSNTSLADAMFTFAPPAGTDIIRND